MGYAFALDLATIWVRRACFTIATLICLALSIYAADRGGAVEGE